MRVRAFPTVVALLALFVAGSYLAFRHGRRAGTDRLETVLARHAAEGYGIDLDGAIATGPRVDAAVQERAWEWLQQERDTAQAGWSSQDWDWFVAGEAVPGPVRARQEAFRAQAEALHDLLHEGAVLTSFGWLAMDRERLARDPWAASPRIPPFVRLLEGARWFATETLGGADRVGALEALDRLRDATARPGLPIDALVGATLAQWRDRALLLLALRGEAPEAVLAPWVEEPPLSPEAFADAFRVERLVWGVGTAHLLLETGSLARAGVRERTLLEDPARWFDQRVTGPARWPRDCAAWLEEQVAFEGWLRGRVPLAELRARERRLEGLGHPFDGWQADRSPLVLAFVARRLSHRSARAAALLARAEAPPATHSEARLLLGSHAALLDDGAWDVALRYERPAPDRFRLVVDPATPLPGLLAPDAVPSLDASTNLLGSRDGVVVRPP